MAKSKINFVCNECGGESPVWKGQCPHCKAWDSMKEFVTSKSRHSSKRDSWTGTSTKMIELDEVDHSQSAQRYTSGIDEFDRVLGGGLIVGGVVLLGGDPGIGKSTLLIQALASCTSVPRLYVTGEESPSQVSSRAKRLGLETKGIGILSETELEDIIANTKKRFSGSPGLLVIDSIQTMYSQDIPSAPGTVTQVRDCAARLTRLAKQNGITVILVGHVTKDGNLAGPRVLEHLVDTVLYFEGDPQSPHRLIRAFKNRFGAAQEIGAFEMTEKGLISISNPSSMFLNQDRADASGSCVFAYQEGTRPLLLEIQALVTDMQGSSPKRLAVGMDHNRANMMLAILNKHGGLEVADQDVFINVVGGLRIQEPALDLPVVLAMISSMSERPLPDDLVCFGEVGLTGELRPVQGSIDRLKEAARLGFKTAIVPHANVPESKIDNIKVIGVKTLTGALGIIDSMSSKRKISKSK